MWGVCGWGVELRASGGAGAATDPCTALPEHGTAGREGSMRGHPCQVAELPIQQSSHVLLPHL